MSGTLSDVDPILRRVRVLHGRGEIAGWASVIEDLQLRTGCPFSARMPWQTAWLDCWPAAEPLAVLVEAPGCLAAAALLAVLPSGRSQVVVAVGHERSDHIRLPAIDETAATMLARGIRSELDSMVRPWRLVLARVPATDLAVAAVSAELSHVWSRPVGPSPQLEVGRDRSVRAHVSRNHHQQVRRMRNRLRRDGHVVAVRHIDDEVGLAALLPEVERLYRARDRMVGRTCDLDDPAVRQFFHQVLREAASRRELLVTALDVDSALAAYVVCFRDGTARRMWNCRFDPAWAAYGVGRLALHSSLEHALDDPTCELYDWMEGTEAYKASVSNWTEPAASLYATSSLAQRLRLESLQRARDEARELRDRHPRLRRLSDRLQRWAAR